MPLEQLDHFQILERLKGEFVYKARDTHSGETVAIKLQRSGPGTDAELKARFEREIKVERMIDHPNVARFHHVGVTQVSDRELGRATGATSRASESTVIYLVKEYVEGETLRALLDRGRPSISKTLEIAMQIARGLDSLHAHGIVHRDVQPESIRITANGVVKLVDFNLVKIIEEESTATESFQTQMGSPVGTSTYFAPEQIMCEEVDAATDLFGLGVLMYEMLTGDLPFPMTNLVDYFRAVLNDPPTPITELRPDIPPELGEIVHRLLEKEMANRYHLAAQLAVDLARLDVKLQ